jgi:hypothetical protein
MAVSSSQPSYPPPSGTYPTLPSYVPQEISYGAIPPPSVSYSTQPASYIPQPSSYAQNSTVNVPSYMPTYPTSLPNYSNNAAPAYPQKPSYTTLSNNSSSQPPTAPTSVPRPNFTGYNSPSPGYPMQTTGYPPTNPNVYGTSSGYIPPPNNYTPSVGYANYPAGYAPNPSYPSYSQARPYNPAPALPPKVPNAAPNPADAYGHTSNNPPPHVTNYPPSQPAGYHPNYPIPPQNPVNFLLKNHSFIIGTSHSTRTRL